MGRRGGFAVRSREREEVAVRCSAGVAGEAALVYCIVGSTREREREGERG